jgi:hypothetical protein
VPVRWNQRRGKKRCTRPPAAQPCGCERAREQAGSERPAVRTHRDQRDHCCARPASGVQAAAELREAGPPHVPPRGRGRQRDHDVRRDRSDRDVPHRHAPHAPRLDRPPLPGCVAGRATASSGR